MGYLLATSILWAFSFGLIKGQLTGVDPGFVAFVRLGLCALVFLPFLRRNAHRPVAVRRLLLIGAVQFGLMYLLYIRSYQFLKGHEVALFTVLTPLYVALLSKSGRRGRILTAAAIACVGAGVISWRPVASEDVWIGFGIVQAANLCFAWGQVAYRRHRLESEASSNTADMAITYIGACLVTGIVSAFMTDWPSVQLSNEQVGTLLYLGLLPSGLGFYLWNLGATRVGSGTLAVMNDAKVPLAVLLSFTVFGEKAELIPLAIGGATIALAWILVRRH
ncbi:MAG: drug/metabolite transporter (DMT)-like permease [Planctomycetota bacterium]|jgi:drug/metabolite transporter (DMT)-like permease